MTQTIEVMRARRDALANDTLPWMTYHATRDIDPVREGRFLAARKWVRREIQRYASLIATAAIAEGRERGYRERTLADASQPTAARDVAHVAKGPNKPALTLVKRGFALWWVWDDEDGYHARNSNGYEADDHTYKTLHERDCFMNGTEYLLPEYKREEEQRDFRDRRGHD